jgi:hypothetical protein
MAPFHPSKVSSSVFLEPEQGLFGLTVFSFDLLRKACH